MVLEYFNTIFAFAVVMLLFSLVITTLVQIVIAIGGLRSRNLQWAVTRLFDRIPGLKENAAEIAEKALEHPAITTSGRKAKVIGSKELLAVLNDLADSSNTSLNKDTKLKLKTALDKILPKGSRNHAEKLAEEFKRLFPNEASKMEDTLKLVQAKALKVASDFNTWFDTIMSRSTERFVKNTRIWTIVFAVLLSFGLQINSFDLLKNLSTDAELRAGLIQMADQTLARAEDVLFTQSVAVKALESAGQSFEDLKEEDIPTNLITRSEGLVWLADQFKTNPNLTEMQKAYEEKFDKLTPVQFKELNEQINVLKSDLEASRMVIFPENFKDFVKNWLCNFFGKLPGILLSLILLSLGAPFWFNILRSLASLRPILAGKTDPSKSDGK